MSRLCDLVPESVSRAFSSEPFPPTPDFTTQTKNPPNCRGIVMRIINADPFDTGCP